MPNSSTPPFQLELTSRAALLLQNASLGCHQPQIRTRLQRPRDTRAMPTSSKCGGDKRGRGRLLGNGQARREARDPPLDVMRGPLLRASARPEGDIMGTMPLARCCRCHAATTAASTTSVPRRCHVAAMLLLCCWQAAAVLLQHRCHAATMPPPRCRPSRCPSRCHKRCSA